MSSEKRKYELKARAERLAATRQRIVEAAAGLHAELGPARTTVAEIARRAGVQRDTVYKHFPEDGDLFAACGDYSMARNPPPDLSAALALDDPAECLYRVLASFYGWYRRMARGLENLQRDRLFLPALDVAMKARMDQPISVLVDSLARRIAAADHFLESVDAMVALAFDFWAWRRLAAHHLSDEASAALMTTAVLAAAGRPELSSRWRSERDPGQLDQEPASPHEP